MHVCRVCTYVNSVWSTWNASKSTIGIAYVFDLLHRWSDVMGSVLENMFGLSSSCQWDLSQRWSVRLRSGRQYQSNLLSESLFTRQAISRSQDALLRCRAIFILCFNSQRFSRLSLARLLFQRETLSTEIQSLVYHCPAEQSTSRLRTLSHRSQLSPFSERRSSRHTRTTIVHPRRPNLRSLLETQNRRTSFDLLSWKSTEMYLQIDYERNRNGHGWHHRHVAESRRLNNEIQWKVSDEQTCSLRYRGTTRSF